MSIPSAIRSRVEAILDELEAENAVSVLYACESGSRAWGFASKDSDFDVRFLYVHPPRWYLSVDLEEKRDVVERPIEGELDVNGWDLRKALRLFRRSNPPLLEWLGSPIVYREPFSTTERMRKLALRYYSPTACAYHYLHMARGNFREFLRGEQVRRKKYLYVLRPLLAIRWIEMDLGVIPTPFEILVNRTVSSEPLRAAIEELLEEKKRGSERDRGPRIDAISTFVESELARLENSRFDKKPALAPPAELNQLFREALEEVFGISSVPSGPSPTGVGANV